MSPQPSSPAEVPSQTAAVARAAFPWGNAYMRLRDGLGTVFTDAQVTAVFSSRGRPAEAPWRLARVAVLQFAENLSDRRAAEVARGRIDWKYLLSLDLTDPGEFRSRLVAGHAETLLLDTLLGPVPRAPVPGGARPSAHRQHACPGGRAQPHPPRLRHRDPACRARCPRRHCSRMAACPCRGELERA
jgi:transposase